MTFHVHARPALQGSMWALLSAMLFGVSTPLIQRFSESLGVFGVAALLYAGAAMVAGLTMQPPQREAQVQRRDFPRLLAMAAFGAVLGPVALVWGLQRTSAGSASLMLTMEAVVTALLAWALYRESMDRRVWAAMACLLVGGGLLVMDRGLAGTAQLGGVLAVLLATVAWGFDNTLSRALADRDPSQVVLFKSLLGATFTGLLALLWGERWPSTWGVCALLAIGATGYGLSLRFYLLAQRAFGAARAGSVFAFAPFIGAVAAYAAGDVFMTWLSALAALLMLLGVALHLSETHDHEHAHPSLEHEHAHTHDDDHHHHRHDPMPEGAHSHLHRHETLRHRHAHVPDLHHDHEHG